LLAFVRGVAHCPWLHPLSVQQGKRMMGSALRDDDVFQEGRITSEQFLQACSEFVALPQAQCDAWTLQKVPALGDQVAYLSRTCFQAVQLPVQSEDQVTVTTNGQHRRAIVQCRYDILYSLAHCVPVLYFMVYDASGSPIFQIEDIWELWNVKDHKTNGAWNILSLQDHPISNTPFYFIHPCNTCNILKDCHHEDGNTNSTCLKYLISWMSVVGNQFGLDVSNSYFKDFK